MNIYIRNLRVAIDKIHPVGDKCWTELEKLIVLRKINRKEYYSFEGEVLNYLSFLCSGILRAYHIDDNGNEWNEHFFMKNDFVTSGVSPEIKNISNIQAISETEILTISFSKLIELSVKYPEINIFIQKLSFKCLENRQRRELLLQSNDAQSAYNFFKLNFPNLENKIQQYHIASYIGISPTQLTRIKNK